MPCHSQVIGLRYASNSAQMSTYLGRISSGELCENRGQVSLDDHYIYVFVRQDFSLSEQFLDGMHAAERLAVHERYSEDGIPNIVLIGLPSEKSLKRAVRYMSECGLHCCSWFDPDKGLEIRALAVGPVHPEQKHLLKKYVLYSPGAKSACFENEDGRTKAAVAQEREHSTFSREVGSSSLSSGSINCS